MPLTISVHIDFTAFFLVLKKSKGRDYFWFWSHTKYSTIYM